MVIKSFAQFIQNENSPVITEQAFLKRKKASSYMDANNIMQTTHIVEFEVGKDHQLMKFTVTNRIYRVLEENTIGMLTHQGTRFKAFEWNGTRVEK